MHRRPGNRRHAAVSMKRRGAGPRIHLIFFLGLADTQISARVTLRSSHPQPMSAVSSQATWTHSAADMGHAITVPPLP
jgi:hypothetical protein